ncbi:MAG: GTPase HflX [Planctomycetes bacterium]|nr:GTPase HflX [Planctomycetota bacterium]
MSDRTFLDELNYSNQKAVLVGITLPSDVIIGDDPLAELASLADTAGLDVVGRVYQKRQHIDASTYCGKGKAEEIALHVKAEGAKLVVFDNELRPGQQRNLEEVVGVPVIDRTELILAIFANHAQTRQAKVQVQIAQLDYQLPRLKNLWTHLERQRGGMGAVGGAGERQIETDRRLLNKRIDRMKDELTEILKRREVEVSRRKDLFQIAIVGYTNAGKSTLMNALTSEGVLAVDRLFATLDTRTCVWKLPDHKVLLSDTVGFIHNLPHRLVASFNATLEEVKHADLLLHVVDASHQSAESMIKAVNDVLKEIGADDRRVLMVFNKIDQVKNHAELEILHRTHHDYVDISAMRATGLKELAARVQKIVEEGETALDWTFSAANGKLLAYLKQHGKILTMDYEDNDVRVKALLEPRFVKAAMDMRDA